MTDRIQNTDRERSTLAKTDRTPREEECRRKTFPNSKKHHIHSFIHRSQCHRPVEEVNNSKPTVLLANVIANRHEDENNTHHFRYIPGVNNAALLGRDLIRMMKQEVCFIATV